MLDLTQISIAQGLLPIAGYTWRLRLKGMPFLSSQKIAILVYERVTKSAAKWKK